MNRHDHTGSDAAASTPHSAVSECALAAPVPGDRMRPAASAMRAARPSEEQAAADADVHSGQLVGWAVHSAPRPELGPALPGASPEDARGASAAPALDWGPAASGADPRVRARLAPSDGQPGRAANTTKEERNWPSQESLVAFLFLLSGYIAMSVTRQPWEQRAARSPPQDPASRWLTVALQHPIRTPFGLLLLALAAAGRAGVAGGTTHGLAGSRSGSQLE
jgi:hypothetical protein